MRFSVYGLLLSGDGAPAGILAQLAVTEAGDAVSSAAAVAVAATAAKAEAADVVTASGAVLVAGQCVGAEASQLSAGLAVTVSASAALAASDAFGGSAAGVISALLAAASGDSLAASAVVELGVLASGEFIEVPDQVAASAGVWCAASLAQQDVDTLAAQAQVSAAAIVAWLHVGTAPDYLDQASAARRGPSTVDRGPRASGIRRRRSAGTARRLPLQR